VSVAVSFDQFLAQQGCAPDPSQRAAAKRLDMLADALRERRSADHKRSLFSRWISKTPVNQVRGVYLWGGVGRGKTALVDLLAREMEGRVRRLHFHRFMHEVHDLLRSLRTQHRTDPVAEVAATFARDIDLLCFDELYVHDIADAMILGGIFEGLVAAGVSLVFTSNVPPSGLYRDGLQRSRFLPTISLLERVTDVIEVDAGIDYRLRELQKAPVFTLTDLHAENFLNQRFEALSTGEDETSHFLQIEGRAISVRRRRDGVVWFDFRALCEGPRGTDDYIAIACQFHTVILSGVPLLGADDNAARRFIALVDELYERGVKLLLSSQVPFNLLYDGDRLAFEFRRTVSRLTEMQSTDYLGLPHRP
jgi:cell division protein ZapE